MAAQLNGQTFNTEKQRNTNTYVFLYKNSSSKNETLKEMVNGDERLTASTKNLDCSGQCKMPANRLNARFVCDAKMSRWRCLSACVTQPSSHTHIHTQATIIGHTCVGTSKHCGHFGIDTYLVGALVVLTDGAVEILLQTRNFVGNLLEGSYTTIYLCKSICAFVYVDVEEMKKKYANL